ncbi:MAG: type II secretion system protein [Planctomycetota bacterium]|jgi:prepilin-type N-terminal cleavage/methylation domain-containing protein
MGSKKGFTLIELMVVILIIGILAAVAMAVLRGRADSAKWTEGKAGASSISTSLRAYAAEKGATGTYPPTLATLGFIASDLHGKYFTIANYSIAAAAFATGNDPELTFTVQVTSVGTGIVTPTHITLNEAGNWVETP